MWNDPFLWERRARNEESMILKKENNPKVTMRTRERQGK
jgi:hypothetical protein